MSDFKSLLPPNATAAERALEQAMARIADVPTPVRQVRNAAECPTNLLAWEAWARGLRRWSAAWPENVRRAVVREAIPLQRRMGSVKSVLDAVRAYGAAIIVREWFEMDPPGPPHTFDVVLSLTGADGEPASAAFVEDVVAEINRVKPARAHFTFTQALKASASLALTAAARPAVYRRIRFQTS